MLTNCYDKIEVALENRGNYVEIEKTLMKLNNKIYDASAVKYVTLVEQLIKLRRLHMAIYDNIKLHVQADSVIILVDLVSFILWSILTNYATVDLILNPITWTIDQEYCILIVGTHFSIVSVCLTLWRVENMKKPVSCFNPSF